MISLCTGKKETRKKRRFAVHEKTLRKPLVNIGNFHRRLLGAFSEKLPHGHWRRDAEVCALYPERCPGGAGTFPPPPGFRLTPPPGLWFGWLVANRDRGGGRWCLPIISGWMLTDICAGCPPVNNRETCGLFIASCINSRTMHNTFW